MSTFKLSGRGAIKIGVFRPIVRFISKKTYGYELGNTGIDVGLMRNCIQRDAAEA